MYGGEYDSAHGPAAGGSGAGGGGYGQVDVADADTGCNGPSIVRVFTAPPGVLRAVEWLCAVIAFGAMSDASCSKCPHDVSAYGKISDFAYLVAIGVIVWLYVSAIATASVLDLHSRFPWLPRVELALDAVFAFLLFVGALAAAARCSTNIHGGNVNYCDSVAYGKKPYVIVCAPPSSFLPLSLFSSPSVFP